MELSTILSNTQNPNAQIRQEAEAQLKRAMDNNMEQFLLSLVDALGNETYDIIIRQMAGLYMKNLLTANDAIMREQKIHAWLNLNETLRLEIKKRSLAILHSTNAIARHTSAQLISKIALIELPNKLWSELLTTLLQNSRTGDEGAMHASLETLGYICEEMDENCLEQTNINQILIAIVDGLRVERPIPIRLAAITALRNALDFIYQNFENENERNHIMQVICETTQCQDVKVRVVAFECISLIASSYYKQLAPYMNTLYQLTVTAIKDDAQEVGLQAIDFWSSLCDVEITLMEDYEYQMEGNPNAQILNKCQYYSRAVLPNLIPVLAECLQKQEECFDDDTVENWNISMGASTCLGLLAQAVRNDILPVVTPFIKNTIESTNWHEKEAAIMAFGAILNGPETAALAPYIGSGLPILLNSMNDPNLLVRDTTAWVIGRICELHSSGMNPNILAPLINTLLGGLNQEPKVASNVCYAIHNLARGFERSHEAMESILLPCFNQLFDTLLKVNERTDIHESNLRSAVFEAISMLIQISSLEPMKAHIVLRLEVFVEKLEQCTTLNNSPPTHDISNYQSTLCSVLLSIAQRRDIDLTMYADRIMSCMLYILRSNMSTSGEKTDAHDQSEQTSSIAIEETFLLIGSLANLLNHDFIRYMEYFMPGLVYALQHFSDSMVCIAAVGVVGDLCRALEKQILPYCETLVAILYDLSRNPTLNRAIKPPVISCFGDIALSIEGAFENFCGPIVEIIFQAAKACEDMNAVNDSDDDCLEYMNSLKESILEGLTGIIQGLASDEKQNLMAPFVQNILLFIFSINQTKRDAKRQPAINENILSGSVGLIGDLAYTLKGAAKEPLIKQKDFIAALIRECVEVVGKDNENAKSIGLWTQKAVADACS